MGSGARVIVNIVTLVLLFIVPWWVTLIFVVGSLFVFENFYESIVFGLLLDGFHGQAGITFYGLNALFTITISIVFIISIFLKTRLTFYAD